MAGHFECIGIDGEDELRSVLDAAVAAGNGTTFEQATELVWRDDGGASVAVTVGADGEIECARPSFAAEPRTRVRVGGIAEDRECAYCSRLLVDVVDEDGEDFYPLAVELERHGPARAARDRTTPIAITAFAESIESWASEDEYEAQHPGPGFEDGKLLGEPTLASRSVLPTGLFVEEPKRRFWQRSGGEPVPTADALITGVVRESGERRNSITGRPFTWMLVDTFGGSYDVVAPPDVAVAPGAAVQGGFWLIGALPES